MNTRKIAGTGVLMALTVVLTLISNYITIANISINLSLLPIAVAGILYGPLSALLIGLVNGALVIAAPATITYFLSVSVVGTVTTCLLKTSLAGLISAYLYKLCRYLNTKENHPWKFLGEIPAMVICSLIIPILNTFFFFIGTLIFFKSYVGTFVSLFITANFAIEFFSTLVLAPGLSKSVLALEKRKQEQKA